MVKGLILGKFMPLHQGHIDLISFALQNCDQLTISLCANNTEAVDPEIRLQWLQELYGNDKRIIIDWVSDILPRSQKPCPEIGRVWSQYFANRYPETDVIISSEKYGHDLASFMGCHHVLFDHDRTGRPVSSTMIRNNPQAHWCHIPETVRAYYTETNIVTISQT